jgi:hypothetical protein
MVNERLCGSLLRDCAIDYKLGCHCPSLCREPMSFPPVPAAICILPLLTTLSNRPQRMAGWHRHVLPARAVP